MPTSGRLLDRPLAQMHNRGNGKGGGVCALGCFAGSADLFAVQLGYLEEAGSEALDEEIRRDLLEPVYRIEAREEQPRLADPSSLRFDVNLPRREEEEEPLDVRGIFGLGVVASWREAFSCSPSRRAAAKADVHPGSGLGLTSRRGFS